MKVVRWAMFGVLIIIFGFLIFLAIHPDNSPAWTGFGTYEAQPNITRYKTLWDWLGLIIIPFSVALFTWIFTEFEKDKSRRSEEEKLKNDTLDSLIKVITELLVQHDLAGNPNSRNLIVTRTRINMALSLLDGSRKGQLLQFLYESGLIDKSATNILLGANFNNAILDNIVLGDSKIKGAHFKNASLKNTNLNEIELISCDLENANLSGSLVNKANLSYTNLTNAKLFNMDLTTAEFEGTNLSKADLNGSTITQSQLDNILSENKKGIKLKKTKII